NDPFAEPAVDRREALRWADDQPGDEQSPSEGTADDPSLPARHRVEGGDDESDADGDAAEADDLPGPVACGRGEGDVEGLERLQRGHGDGAAGRANGRQDRQQRPDPYAGEQR